MLAPPPSCYHFPARRKQFDRYEIVIGTIIQTPRDATFYQFNQQGERVVTRVFAR